MTDLEKHLLAIERTQAAIDMAAACEELVRWFKLTATQQNEERQQRTYEALQP